MPMDGLTFETLASILTGYFIPFKNDRSRMRIKVLKRTLIVSLKAKLLLEGLRRSSQV
jgi:hypothetical protein